MTTRSLTFLLTLILATAQAVAAPVTDNSQSLPSAKAASINTKKAKIVLQENFDNATMPTSVGLATPEFEVWYDNLEVTLDNWIMPNKSLIPVIDSLLLDDTAAAPGT